MALSSGNRLGPYEILAAIGAGGMGEVYRARDSKLGRDVALKVLPDAFARDAERMARFQREAKVLASLNHPYIASIYGLEDSGSTHALVMELVEGPTLADRIRSGPIPIDEALRIARQICDAMEYAHERGIVHRDLKPANVKVTNDDAVKVLDFGLAKAIEGDAASTDMANSPTLSRMATQAGVLLGTAAYMSPEQAKGKAVDRRADIWAFGCVLYEMLTGKVVFRGETVTDTLAAVIKEEPDWSQLPATTPIQVRVLLQRCLQKDLKQRLQAIGEARISLDGVLSGAPLDSSPVSLSAVAARRERLAWVVALVMTLLAVTASIVALVWRSTSRPPASPEVRLQIVTPTSSGGEVLLSPDGRQIAYGSTSGPGLWLRPLDSEVAKLLADTAGGAWFWSPDSQSIGFFASQKLKRIDVASGTVRTLADAPTPRGGTWNADGTILFAPGGNGPLYRVASAGGAPEPVTRLAAQDAGHRDPEFLADGHHFIFWVLGPPGVRGEYIGSLDATDVHRLFDADGPASWAPPDQVLFVREGVLYAQRVDLNRFALTGDPLPIASDLSAVPTGRKPASASMTGIIAYYPAARVRRQLVWRDRSGRQVGTIGDPLVDYDSARLSPDGRFVAIDRFVSGEPNIWLMDTARGTLDPFTSDGASNFAWSPDSRRIAFCSDTKGVLNIYWRDVGSASPAELLLESSEAKNVSDWSPDGKYILFATQSPVTARDLWALPVQGPEHKPFAVVQGPAEETAGIFSPDSKWIAYTSDESGRNEIYVRPFPGPGRAWPISTNGGQRPFWRRDGKEIFYVTAGSLMAVTVRLRSDGTIDAGTPTSLFTEGAGEVLRGPSDGQRFLSVVALDDKATPPITVIVNWAGLSRGRDR